MNSVWQAKKPVFKKKVILGKKLFFDKKNFAKKQHQSILIISSKLFDILLRLFMTFDIVTFDYAICKITFANNLILGG